MKYDKTTSKWFKAHHGVQTTVVRCEKYQKFYKPSLGHECRKEIEVRKNKRQRKKWMKHHFGRTPKEWYEELKDFKIRFEAFCKCEELRLQKQQEMAQAKGCD